METAYTMTPLDTIIKSYNAAIAVEAYDWSDQVILNEQCYIELMQHCSAGGLLDRNKARWAALNIATLSADIYFIGDSGYGESRYCKQANEKFGTFGATSYGNLCT